MTEEITKIEEETAPTEVLSEEILEPSETEEVEVEVLSTEEESPEKSIDEMETVEEVSREESEDACEGPRVFVLEEDDIQRVKMPRPAPGPMDASVLKKQAAHQRYIFHGMSRDGEVDPNEVAKAVLSFDPRVPEEAHKPFKKPGPFGIGSPWAQPKKRGHEFVGPQSPKYRFTGRGGQVHKVSADGEVLNELVGSSPPEIQERVLNVLDSIRTEVSDFISPYRVWIADRLLKVEDKIRPKEKEEVADVQECRDGFVFKKRRRKSNLSC